MAYPNGVSPDRHKVDELLDSTGERGFDVGDGADLAQNANPAACHIPVIGVVLPGAKVAAETTKNGKIGVIATESTIESHLYNRVIQAHNPQAEVFGKACPLFCPLVEEDDEGDGEDGLKAVKAHAQELACGPLRDFRVGLTYGGQPSREKTAALADFAAGRTQVLVATTVIEVGVNVPNATVMIVEDADRYGLAQLHQLRGRVGRGSGQSWCFLMARPNDRLRALAATNDGFEVARADLEQRGPGELLGARQHGAAASLAVGNSQLLYEAARCAEELWTLSEWAPERDAVAGQARLRLQQLEERVSIS